MEWIRRSTWAVSTYFGQFPVRQVGLLVVAGDSTRIGSGPLMDSRIPPFAFMWAAG
jgi:hypothetical protein